MTMVPERDYNLKVMPCPRRIKSYTVKNRNEDYYTIVLSTELSDSERLKAYIHEMDHIVNGDFDYDVDVEEAEVRAHGKER